MANSAPRGLRSTAIVGGIVSIMVGIAVWWQPFLLGHLLERPDTVTHLRWSHQFFVALQEGVLYPRWAFASHQGLGDPTFLYYQPAFYYVTALISAMGFAAERSVVIAASLPFFLLAWIAYAKTIDQGQEWRAVAAAAILATCPAVFFLMMDGGALPWGLAIPFCILFVLESIEDQPRIANAAVLLAVICLTHLLSGLVILMCVGLGRLIFAFPSRKTWESNVRWTISVAVGTALAGFFIYPAISQQFLINPGAWTTDPSLNWHRGFAFPAFTWWRYGLQWFAFQWALPLLALAFSVLIIVILRRGQRKRLPNSVEVRAWRLAVVALAGLLLSSEFSYPLFALITPLQKLQWAYRFVPVSLALASLAFCTIAFRAHEMYEGRRLRVASIVLMVGYGLLVCATQYKVYIGGKSLRPLEAAMQGEFGQPEYLVARRGSEWQRYNQDGQLAGECRLRRAQCAIETKQTHQMSLTVTARDATTIRLPIFVFPAWQIRVDGEVQPLAFDQATGLITVPVGVGKHSVAVTWIGLPAQATGRLFSWVGLAMLALIVIGGNRTGPCSTVLRRRKLRDA